MSGLLQAGATSLGGMYAGSQSVNIPDPNSMRRDQQVMMSPEMFRATFDEDWRRENPAQAALLAYRHRYQPEVQLGYRLGEEIGQPMLRGGVNGAHNLFSQGPATSALLGALMLGGLTYAGAKGYNALPFTRELPFKPRDLAAVGAGVGGLSGLIGNRIQAGTNRPYARQPLPPLNINPEEYYGQINQFMGKSASFAAPWRSSNSSNISAYGEAYVQQRDELNRMIRMLHNLSAHEQGELINALDRLYAQDPSAIGQLRNLVGTFGGAGAGAVIANFLMKRGVLPTIIGALAGAAIGRTLFNRKPPRPNTFFNQPIGTFY